jgi:hypothetical protein
MEGSLIVCTDPLKIRIKKSREAFRLPGDILPD